MSELLIEIKDLECNIDNQKILQGLNLKINKGEVHAIMGPNGSGKSTLSSVLAGNDNYEITNGSITFLGEDITTKTIVSLFLACSLIGIQLFWK